MAKIWILITLTDVFLFSASLCLKKLAQKDMVDSKKKNEVTKIIQLLDHYKTSKSPDFSVEFRPSLKKAANGEFGPIRIWPDNLWTEMKKIQVIKKLLHKTNS